MRASPLLLACLLIGCDLDARDLAYPGATVYQPPGADFHFHYLSPPWLLDKTPPETLLQLFIPATIVGPGTIPASHVLRVLQSSAASPQSAAELERATALAGGRTLARDLTPFKTLGDDPGWDLQAYIDLPPGRSYIRETFFSSATGQVVRFSQLSAYPLDEPDIEDLLQSYSARPDPGTAGPERLR